jgi:hypothetical protein
MANDSNKPTKEKIEKNNVQEGKTKALGLALISRICFSANRITANRHSKLPKH